MTVCDSQQRRQRQAGQTGTGQTGAPVPAELGEASQPDRLAACDVVHGHLRLRSQPSSSKSESSSSSSLSSSSPSSSSSSSPPTPTIRPGHRTASGLTHPAVLTGQLELADRAGVGLKASERSRKGSERSRNGSERSRNGSERSRKSSRKGLRARPSPLKVSTPAHTKHQGWRVDVGSHNRC